MKMSHIYNIFIPSCRFPDLKYVQNLIRKSKNLYLGFVTWFLIVCLAGAVRCGEKIRENLSENFQIWFGCVKSNRWNCSASVEFDRPQCATNYLSIIRSCRIWRNVSNGASNLAQLSWPLKNDRDQNEKLWFYLDFLGIGISWNGWESTGHWYALLIF